MPILIQTIPFMPRRRVRRVATNVVAPLALVAAAYDPAELTVSLTFDRAIDVAALDGTQIGIADSVTNLARYQATGTATLIGPAQVRIGLAFVEGFGDPYGVFFNATANSGIVAVDDGGSWAGANELELPWP